MRTEGDGVITSRDIARVMTPVSKADANLATLLTRSQTRPRCFSLRTMHTSSG